MDTLLKHVKIHQGSIIVKDARSVEEVELLEGKKRFILEGYTKIQNIVKVPEVQEAITLLLEDMRENIGKINPGEYKFKLLAELDDITEVFHTCFQIFLIERADVDNHQVIRFVRAYSKEIKRRALDIIDKKLNGYGNKNNPG